MFYTAHSSVERHKQALGLRIIGKRTLDLTTCFLVSLQNLCSFMACHFASQRTMMADSQARYQNADDEKRLR